MTNIQLLRIGCRAYGSEGEIDQGSDKTGEPTGNLPGGIDLDPSGDEGIIGEKSKIFCRLSAAKTHLGQTALITPTLNLINCTSKLL
ncbi:MAG: hypothetical protein MUP16_08990 [Sedimentisphaerales bacterium]|nr:hypothetical protein [Sedimentisphaerales bacterium]